MSMRPMVFVSFLASIAIATACSATPDEGFGTLGSAAKIAGDKKDCFPSCSAADHKELLKGGLKAACKTLKGQLQDPKTGVGWDDKKPICIGWADDIRPRKDCNRLVDWTEWTPCNNQLMLECSKAKEPGFGSLILVPRDGKQFPPPANPKKPGYTDQELECIRQWSCTVDNPNALPDAGTTRPKSLAYGACEGGDCPTVCTDDGWIIEEPAISDVAVPLEEPAPKPVPSFTSPPLLPSTDDAGAAP